MKVYISGDTRDHKIVEIVKRLGHEVIIPRFSSDGKGVEGVTRQSIEKADAVIFFLPSHEKRGIMDHLAAYNNEIPNITFNWNRFKNKHEVREEKKFGISENISTMSNVEFVSGFDELEERTRNFLREITINKETEPGYYKERF